MTPQRLASKQRTALLLASLVRLVDLGRNPPGFFCDEASVGYDAYSLLHTARDQYGAFLPLFARSFGDYDEALLRYLTVPSIAVFGLNEFATRLPAALVGTLTVLLVFLLAGELFSRDDISLMAAFLLAISPWHVLFSRVAFRAVLLPFCFCLALWLFMKGLKAPRFLIAAAAAFALALWTYSSARVFVPLFVGVLALVCGAKLWRAGRHAILAAVLFGAVLAVLATFWLSPDGMARAKHELASAEGGSRLHNYLSYFSPSFLFVKGDTTTPRHRVNGVGELHLFEMATVLAGLALLVRAPRTSRWVLLSWLVLFPIPAALTSPVHALRSIIGAPLFAILSGLGLHGLYQRGVVLARRATPVILSLVVALSFGVYAKRLFVDFPRDSSFHWQYGLREAIQFSQQKPYKRVYVSDQFFLPHIFVLFYTAYPPTEYQRAPLQTLRQGNWGYTNFDIGRYRICSIAGLRPVQLSNSLLMVWAQVEGVQQWSGLASKTTHVVRNPKGEEVIRLIEP